MEVKAVLRIAYSNQKGLPMVFLHHVASSFDEDIIHPVGHGLSDSNQLMIQRYSQSLVTIIHNNNCMI